MKGAQLRFVLPNGGTLCLQSKVIPRLGDEVNVEGHAWGSVARVLCKFDRGAGDTYVIYLATTSFGSPANTAQHASR